MTTFQNINTQRNVVLSLYDFTGEAVKPWAVAGFECICFDIQHDINSPHIETFTGGGSITYRNADLHSPATLDAIATEYAGRVAFLMAFPVCTDMAVSGAAHFASKRKANPSFQSDAVSYAVACGDLGDRLACPYFVENPISVLSTQWRKPDHIFQPFEYGGYIAPHDAMHPTWPEYIAPRDAYPKKTCLWTGGGFIMPERRPVDCPEGYSTQHKKLGGKSMKTKNIRSATPRGFAAAVCIANATATAIT